MSAVTNDDTAFGQSLIPHCIDGAGYLVLKSNSASALTSLLLCRFVL